MFRFIRVYIPRQDEWMGDFIKTRLELTYMIMGASHAYSVQKVPMVSVQDPSMKVGTCYFITVWGRKYQKELMKDFTHYEKWGWLVFPGLLRGNMIGYRYTR